MSGWLEKNKDPLNDSVVEQLKKGGNSILSEMFGDSLAGDVIGEKKAKRAKGSTFQTVSALYRVFVSYQCNTAISLFSAQ